MTQVAAELNKKKLQGLQISHLKKTRMVHLSNPLLLL
jgi:hypothetical protein